MVRMAVTWGGGGVTGEIGGEGEDRPDGFSVPCRVEKRRRGNSGKRIRAGGGVMVDFGKRERQKFRDLRDRVSARSRFRRRRDDESTGKGRWSSDVSAEMGDRGNGGCRRLTETGAGRKGNFG